MLWDFLSYGLFTISGVKVTILRIISFISVIVASFLISKFLIGRALNKMLERSDDAEETRSSILKLIMLPFLLEFM